MKMTDSLKASWQESLELLKYDSIRLLLLVSFKTLVTLYRSLRPGWFLPLTLLVGLVLTIPRLLAAFYITLIVRAARPSLAYKDSDYWWHQRMLDDWILFIAVVVILSMSQLLTMLGLSGLLVQLLTWGYDILLSIFFLAEYPWIPGVDQLGTLITFLSPLLIVWLLFLLDSRLTFWSVFTTWYRAVCMIVYNYPFFLVVYLIFRMILAGGYLAFSPLFAFIPYVSLVGWTFLLGVFIPYWVCFITNFYVKRMHEQFSLYYSS